MPSAQFSAGTPTGRGGKLDARTPDAFAAALLSIVTPTGCGGMKDGSLSGLGANAASVAFAMLSVGTPTGCGGVRCDPMPWPVIAMTSPLLTLDLDGMISALHSTLTPPHCENVSPSSDAFMLIAMPLDGTHTGCGGMGLGPTSSLVSMASAVLLDGTPTCCGGKLKALSPCTDVPIEGDVRGMAVALLSVGTPTGGGGNGTPTGGGGIWNESTASPNATLASTLMLDDTPTGGGGIFAVVTPTFDGPTATALFWGTASPNDWKREKAAFALRSDGTPTGCGGMSDGSPPSSDASVAPRLLWYGTPTCCGGNSHPSEPTDAVTTLNCDNASNCSPCKLDSASSTLVSVLAALGWAVLDWYATCVC